VGRGPQRSAGPSRGCERAARSGRRRLLECVWPARSAACAVAPVGGLPDRLRRRLERRLLRGPPRRHGRESAREYCGRKAHSVLGRLIWLLEQGCAFSFDREVNLANLRARPPRWRDEYSGSAARSAFNEADGADQLFQYYLLDTTGFEPNVFTTLFPEVNDRLQLTVTGASCGRPTVGACEWRWNPSLGFRPILTTRARSG
jgi:hypothetical protein